MTGNNAGGGTAAATNLDAAVIGAGFAGLYALKKLRDELGLDTLAFDKAGGVGGTWYWNRYPGALSDSESHVYCYSWDDELLRTWPHKSKYVPQPEILKYLEHVAERHDLYKDIRLNTGITSAVFDEDAARWQLTTDDGQTYSAKYLVTAVGLLAATNIPKIEGMDRFKGKIYHTSRWPGDAGIEGKRVGVIGTGSTGVQFITATAPVVNHLTVFQRSPQYSVPVGNGPLSETELEEIRRDYPKIWEGVRKSALAFGFVDAGAGRRPSRLLQDRRVDRDVAGARSGARRCRATDDRFRPAGAELPWAAWCLFRDVTAAYGVA